MAPQYNCHVNSGQVFVDIKGYKKTKICSVCRKKGHFAKLCPEIRCYYCGRKGHTQKLCWNKQINKVVNYKRMLNSMIGIYNKSVPLVSKVPMSSPCNIWKSSKHEFTIDAQEGMSLIGSPSNFDLQSLDVTNFSFGIIDDYETKRLQCNKVYNNIIIDYNIIHNNIEVHS